MVACMCRLDIMKTFWKGCLVTMGFVSAIAAPKNNPPFRQIIMLQLFRYENLSCDPLTLISSIASWKSPSLLAFFNIFTSSSSSRLPA